MSRLKETKQHKKSLVKIKEATKNFANCNCIGEGGYGKVYKAELIISGKPTTCAIKRLNERYGQGLKEFLTEIQLLSGQKHPNLINLVGFCDEEKEKIIVYEYAESGSLDCLLKRDDNTTTSTCALTWLERLKICVGAARGLEFLHNRVGNHRTIIHRDIKSANILIDENWVAKVSDLGLSRLNSDLIRSGVVSRPCGTPGYCEPEYEKTSIVKKESDVYSFGVVLFEVLCGRLCKDVIKNNDRSLLSTSELVNEYYMNSNFDEIVDPNLKGEMKLKSMEIFAKVAYGCLHADRGERHKMDRVVKELEESFKHQIRFEKVKRILQKFTEYKNNDFKKEKVKALLVATTSNLNNYSQEQISRSIDQVFHSYTIFIEGEEGLTCDAMLKNYDDSRGDIDLDYKLLHLEDKPHNGKEPSFSTWERYEKVWKILQHFDANDDGCLNRDELAALIDDIYLNGPCYDEEKIHLSVDRFFNHYEPYLDGEKGLNFSGLLLIYDQNELDLDLGFQALMRKLQPETNDRDELGERIRNLVGMHWRLSKNFVCMYWRLIAYLAAFILWYKVVVPEIYCHVYGDPMGSAFECSGLLIKRGIKFSGSFQIDSDGQSHSKNMIQ